MVLDYVPTFSSFSCTGYFCCYSDGNNSYTGYFWKLPESTKTWTNESHELHRMKLAAVNCEDIRVEVYNYLISTLISR